MAVPGAGVSEVEVIPIQAGGDHGLISGIGSSRNKSSAGVNNGSVETIEASAQRQTLGNPHPLFYSAYC